MERCYAMKREQVLKSQLLKNVPIEVINQHAGLISATQEEPITVLERDGNYFVLEGLDHLVNMKEAGDCLVDCFVTHKNSFL